MGIQDNTFEGVGSLIRHSQPSGELTIQAGVYAPQGARWRFTVPDGTVWYLDIPASDELQVITYGYSDGTKIEMVGRVPQFIDNVVVDGPPTSFIAPTDKQCGG